MQPEMVMLKQFIEPVQEDGKQDRITIIQAKNEILSLHSVLVVAHGEME